MFEIADFIKARKESKDKITRVISAWSVREETIYEEGFQDGATFGYNKAKEEMQEQIEKMKTCGNCKHHCFWGNELNCRTFPYDEELKCMKTREYWEIKEND